MEGNGKCVGWFSGILLLLLPQWYTPTLRIKRFVLIVFVLILKMNPRSLDLEDISEHRQPTLVFDKWGQWLSEESNLSWVSYLISMSGLSFLWAIFQNVPLRYGWCQKIPVNFCFHAMSQYLIRFNQGDCDYRVIPSQLSCWTSA